MAGFSVEESLRAPRRDWKTEVCFDFVSDSGSDKKLKLKPLFDEFIEVFLKEVLSVSCFRPLPPLIGEGQEVDLFSLHIVVRNRGGYCCVSEKGLWSLVAADCGFDWRVGATLKLVYVKYLDALDGWLRSVVEDRYEEKAGVKRIGFSGLLMKLESDLEVYLFGIPDKVKKEEEVVEFKNGELRSGNEDMGFSKLELDAKSVDNVKIDDKQCGDRGGNVDDRAIDEDSVSRKRKRECYVDMLNWIRKVAKDPCDPAVGWLPGSHTWRSYGSDLQWKQILMARELMFLKKYDDGSSQQSVWQKKQKMHPSMYDDDESALERLRCSKRILLSKDSSRKARGKHGAESSSSSHQSDEDSCDKQTDSSGDSAGILSKPRKKRARVGRHFQADLPELSGADYKSDSIWLGTKAWPLNKGEYNVSLIERDPIGKGRREACGCQVPGSTECVRFHVQEKRSKVKLELGPAFYRWKFDGMGEDVAHSWTIEDQDKFQNIVNSNRISSEKFFWDELFKAFPRKGREALVSYYFNVFLYRRRGHQNRSSTSNIDSDDEESEFGPIANRFGQKAPTGSIFCSPKKSHSSRK